MRFSAILPLLVAVGCSADGDPDRVKPAQTGNSDHTDESSNETGTGSGASEAPAIVGPTSAALPEPILSTIPTPMPPATSSDAGTNQSCASVNAQAELQQLELAFAFDVSGSMGKGDEPYHIKELKWQPVVTASLAFFESNTDRILASLVFFPTADEDEDERCDAASYEQPDVALHELPSDAFRQAIDAVTPEDEEDWRGGTPTLAVLKATITSVNNPDAGTSNSKRAVVLVTDGTPQGCSDEADSIDAVAEEVAALRGVIPVYVIGVANPVTAEEPEPPDNVTSLHRIANAGGTDKAFIIDTGDPEATIGAFGAAIDTIRRSGLSCEVDIPAPPTGMTLDTTKVNVSVTVESTNLDLAYSNDCSEPASWRFDDEDSPSRIVLCPDACEQAQEAVMSAVEVQFGCERRTSVVR